jgi:hypothetical protein
MDFKKIAIISLHKINWPVLIIETECVTAQYELIQVNLPKMKRRLHYLKTQFVPRSKHFSYQL